MEIAIAAKSQALSFLWLPLEAALSVLNLSHSFVKTFFLEGINKSNGDCHRC